MRFNKYVLWLSLIGLTAFVGCGSKSTDAERREEAIPVHVMVVQQGTIEETSKYFGTIEARESIKVFSAVPRQIVKLYRDVGETVRKGDLLADIDQEQIVQAVHQAEAGLESAQAQFQNVTVERERIKKLYQENAISQSQLDAIETQWDAARAAVKQFQASLAAAQAQLNDTRIVAPINGVIVNRWLNEGDLAAPQVPLFEIAHMDTVKVKIQIIERDLSKVFPGQTARITVSTYEDTFFQGRVIRVYPTLNLLTRTADAEIEIANRERQLWPGMFATVNLIFQRKEQVTTIPKETIIEKTVLSAGTDVSTDKVVVEKHVFKVAGNRARWQTIETGIVNHTTVEVRIGLEPGDTIVAVGQHMLSDSSLVNIINP